MPVVVESYIVTVIEINSGKSNNRLAQITADVFNNGFRIAKIGFGINVIEALNKPTLVIAHNKTLAAQLYGEFKKYFPENSVEYFVS